MRKSFIKKQAIKLILIIFAAVILIFTGCQKYSDSKTAVRDNAAESQNHTTLNIDNQYIGKNEEKGKEKQDDSNTDILDGDNEQDDMVAIEKLLKYRPNELGTIMILMYHKIGETESEWVRTPENFRKDLLNLYENGYRLINLLDYVRGNIEIEAGKSPVIITFDDATQGQFKFIETSDGLEIDPDCAVGILEDFCAHYQDFGKGATFYIFYPYPFGQLNHIRAKLEFLVQNGYEIGNHTYSHINLSSVNREDAIIEIALHCEKTSEILPGYEVRSLSLPYGQYPENKDILLAGNYLGYDYVNEAVLLIGSNPAFSPFARGFDPLSIPRIRASEINVDGQGLYDWIEYFKNNPIKKYISNGNSSTIVIPEDLRGQLDEAAAANRKVYFY